MIANAKREANFKKVSGTRKTSRTLWTVMKREMGYKASKERLKIFIRANEIVNLDMSRHKVSPCVPARVHS